MLILKRRAGETIVLGRGPNAVTVKVCEVRGEAVRLAIDAPREVNVRRGELREIPQRPRGNVA